MRMGGRRTGSARSSAIGRKLRARPPASGATTRPAFRGLSALEAALVEAAAHHEIAFGAAPLARRATAPAGCLACTAVLRPTLSHAPPVRQFRASCCWFPVRETIWQELCLNDSYKYKLVLFNKVKRENSRIKAAEKCRKVCGKR